MGKIYNSESVVAPLSRMKISEMAQAMRKKYGYEGCLYFPIQDIIGTMYDSGMIDLEIIDDDLMKGCEARTFPNRKEIQVRQSVYDNAYFEDGRSRFTFAHEFFHLLQHSEENISFQRKDTDEPIQVFRDPEWQANTFASELLIPRDLVKGMSIDEVVEECKVSYQAAKYALEKYGYIKC